MTRPKAEAPYVVKAVNDPHADDYETHPAYAQIGASRVTGSRYLYGSDFLHHNYVTIRIGRSELKRNLSTDWPYAPHTEEIVEVALSEAQWATFVSTLNVGQGVQCTLSAVNGVDVPEIARVPDRIEQFTGEAKARMEYATRELQALGEKIDACGLSAKAKKELKDHLHQATMNLGVNIDYVAKCFGEHVEHNIEKAKTEISAWVSSVIHHTGIEALRGQMPFELPAAADDADLKDKEP